MPPRIYMTRPFWMALVISLVGHVAFVAGFFDRPTLAFLSRGPVRVQIVTPREQSLAPTPKRPTPKPAVKESLSSAPRPIEETAATPKDVPSAQAEGKPAQAASGDRVGSAPQGGGLARDAALVRSSFAQPPYTRAALQARYETDVIAEILVNVGGKAEDVRFASPVQYGMEERLVGSIRGARFEVARNDRGDEIPGWTKIRFRLVIP